MTTEAQLDLLRHTLGLNEWNRIPNRNFYATSEGVREFADLLALVTDGLMTKQVNPEFLGGGFCFRATDSGKTYALDMLPPVEKLSPAKARYQHYLDVGDCYDNFAHFIGIDAPKREYQYSYGSSLVRLTSSRGTGAYCKTLKDAKASYKADMARRKAEDKAYFQNLRIAP